MADVALRETQQHGLKDHEIAQLVSHVTAEVRAYAQRGAIVLPDSLRAVISAAVLAHLEDAGLRLDKREL